VSADLQLWISAVRESGREREREREEKERAAQGYPDQDCCKAAHRELPIPAGVISAVEE